jgi:hypothetical protein
MPIGSVCLPPTLAKPAAAAQAARAAFVERPAQWRQLADHQLSGQVEVQHKRAEPGGRLCARVVGRRRCAGDRCSSPVVSPIESGRNVRSVGELCLLAPRRPPPRPRDANLTSVQKCVGPVSSGRVRGRKIFWTSAENGNEESARWARRWVVGGGPAEDLRDTTTANREAPAGR